MNDLNIIDFNKFRDEIFLVKSNLSCSCDNMSKFTKEIGKFLCFLSAIGLFIYFSEKNIQNSANQFLLSDLTQIHHGKDYLNIQEAGGSKDICPLYPKTLSKK